MNKIAIVVFAAALTVSTVSAKAQPTTDYTDVLYWSLLHRAPEPGDGPSGWRALFAKGYSPREVCIAMHNAPEVVAVQGSLGAAIAICTAFR